MTLEQLKQERDRILAANAWWKKMAVQDGSYEASITFDGFYRIQDQIRELEAVDQKQNFGYNSTYTSKTGAVHDPSPYSQRRLSQ